MLDNRVYCIHFNYTFGKNILKCNKSCIVCVSQALATACWSVLKAKRHLLMVPDGFISHFYAISEYVSPVLAFSFLGLRQHLSEVCTIFKQQIMQYLKDMFDHVNVTSAQSLAEDLLSLSHRHSDILLGYLGIDSLLEPYPKEMQQPAPASPTTPETWDLSPRTMPQDYLT
ncbi:mitoguardin 2-like [Oncorhynchus clarkii lewisi]|uniref:mitoguardin 2-like n=1 Tax=Oncorhynchus clarkii lewisi TaxID=490388 RepID=UPI0039B9BA4C